MASIKHRKFPESLLPDLAAWRGRGPALWQRITAYRKARTCLYCGQHSSDTDIAAFSSATLDSNEPIEDVCPHCLMVGGFTRRSGWEYKSYK